MPGAPEKKAAIYGGLCLCNLLILKVVRKRGFEPLRSCERQPLKLVRLPVPPLARVSNPEEITAALSLAPLALVGKN